MSLNVAQTGIQEFLDGTGNGQSSVTAFVQSVQLKLNDTAVGLGYGLPMQPTTAPLTDYSGVFPGSSGMQVVEVLTPNSNRKYLLIANPNASDIAWGITSSITFNGSDGGSGAVVLAAGGKPEEFSGPIVPPNAIYLIGPAGAAYTVLAG